jgi:hypothetical protein
MWLLSIAVGLTVSVLSYFLIRHVGNVNDAKKEKQFKENYRDLLIKETNELIESVDYLLEESLELASRLGQVEDYVELEKQSSIMKDQMKSVFTEFMSGDDIDESLGTFTLFRDQLISMVDKMDNDINSMRKNLGEERILN